MKNKFFALWLASILSTILLLPYIFDLQREVIAKSTLSLPILGLLSVIQTAFLLAVAIFLGLKLSKSINLPTLEFFESKAGFNKNFKSVFKLGVPIGIIVALVIKFGDLFFSKFIPQIIASADQIPFWKNILVPFYGGIVEELLTRLFLVSLLAWLLGKIFRVKEVVKNNSIMWVSIIVAAVLFGLGHLPATASITQITPVIVLRAILLNGIGGVVFGWLYWKKGLEYGMVAHFFTDVFLIAILPLLLK